MRFQHVNLKVVSFWATLVLAAVLAAGWYLYSRSDTRAYQLGAEAEAHLSEGNPEKARIALWNAVAIRDDIPAFHLMLGRANFQAGELGAAFASYSFANALEPNNLESLIAIGQIGLQIGEIDKSREATRALLLIQPNQTEGLIVQGVHDMLSGRYEQAVENADRILQIEPQHEQGIILKIRALMLWEKSEEAVALLERYAVPVEQSPGLALTELEVRRHLRQADEMIVLFGKLNALLPANTTVKLDEANLLYKLDRPEKATRIIMDALAEKNLDAREISELIRVLRFHADLSDVETHVRSVAKTGSADARVELARYLTAQSKGAEVPVLSEGLPSLESQKLSALSMMHNGQSKAAIAKAGLLLEDDPTDCFVRYIDASSKLDSGQVRDAIYSGQIAAEECPTLIETWDVLGRAYDQLGSPEQARRVFRQGLAANPQEPWLADRYVAWLLAHGREREARAVRRKLAMNLPGYTPVWRHYLSLCESTDAPCVAKARKGLQQSLTTYGIDLPPGERATSGLFGRFLIR